MAMRKFVDGKEVGAQTGTKIPVYPPNRLKVVGGTTGAGGDSVRYGETASETAGAQEGAKLRTKQRETGANIGMVRGNLSTLKDRLEKLPYEGTIDVLGFKVPDPFQAGGRITEARSEFQPGFSSGLKTYKNVKAGFAGWMARIYGGEKGVLTDKDIDRFIGFLPGYTDTSIPGTDQITGQKSLSERDDRWLLAEQMGDNIEMAQTFVNKSGKAGQLKGKVNDDGSITVYDITSGTPVTTINKQTQPEAKATTNPRESAEGATAVDDATGKPIILKGGRWIFQ